MELLTDGMELHLAALKAEFADVLAGPPPGLPPDRGIELVLETGN